MNDLHPCKAKKTARPFFIPGPARYGCRPGMVVSGGRGAVIFRYGCRRFIYACSTLNRNEKNVHAGIDWESFPNAGWGWKIVSDVIFAGEGPPGRFGKAPHPVRSERGVSSTGGEGRKQVPGGCVPRSGTSPTNGHAVKGKTYGRIGRLGREAGREDWPRR